jgi:kinesin family protein 13
MMTREANQMSEELERATKFSVSLQIPPEHLSPNSRSGAFMTQPSILVLRQGEGRQVWPLEKMESRLIAMRELNSMVKDKRVALTEIGDPIPDPFYEAVESHSLVGVANFYLSTLFHGVAFEYYAPIISQNGTVAGKLLVEIQKLAGAFPADRVGHCNEDKDSEATTASVEDVSNGHSSSSNSSGKNNNGASNSITVGIKIKAIVGLPPALAHFVFCEYRFWGESEYTVVPTALEPRGGGGRARKAADTVDFKFDHSRTVKVCWRCL